MRMSCDSFKERKNDANRKIFKWFIKNLTLSCCGIIVTTYGANHTTYRSAKNFKCPVIRAYGISDK